MNAALVTRRRGVGTVSAARGDARWTPPRVVVVVVAAERRRRRARDARRGRGVDDERDDDEYECERSDDDDDDEYDEHDVRREIGALFVVFSFHVARARERRRGRARRAACGVRVRRVRETDDAVRRETLQRHGARWRWMGRRDVFSVCGDISKLAHDERGGD